MRRFRMPSELRPKRTRDSGQEQAILRCLFERVYSTGELSFVDELVGPDFIGDSIESTDGYLGPDGMKTHVTRLRRAFHGFTLEIDALQVEGDNFEVQWTARGTHERPFVGIEPTCNIGPLGEDPHGTRIAVTGDARGVLTNGLLREWIMTWDEESLHRQLGAAASQADHAENKDESSIAMRTKSR